MARYDMSFGENSGLQAGHISGNIYYGGKRPADKAYHVPDLLSPYFTGRTDELARIQEMFEASQTAGPARCIVYGMPGLGKTQLALKFALTSRGKYPFVFWISGATTEKINAGYSDILDVVGGQVDANAKVLAAKRWLEDDHHWLLVVDNINKDTMAHLRDLLPATNSKGNVLVTTRTQQVAESLRAAHGERHDVLDLDTLKQDDAVKLFFATREQDSMTDGEAAAALVRKVGCLPLAIDTAASLSKAYGQTVQSVLDVYSSSNLDEVLKWTSQTGKHESESMMACFDPLLEELSRTCPEGCDLLRILAFLDPEGIPLDIIKDGLSCYKGHEIVASKPRRVIKRLFGLRSKTRPVLQTSPDAHIRRLRVAFQSTTQIERILQALLTLSIIKMKDDSSIWIHDLVHLFIRQRLVDRAKKDAWYSSSLKTINAAFGPFEDAIDPRYWSRTEMFVPHVRALRNTCVPDNDLDLVRLEFLVSNYLGHRGRYSEAGILLEQVYGRLQQLKKSEDEEVWEAGRVLAANYLNLGQLDQAEEHLMEILAKTEKASGINDVLMGEIMHDLARLRISQGRWHESEQLLVRSLAIAQENLDPEDDLCMKIKMSLADTYARQERFQEAESLYVQLLDAFQAKDDQQTLRNLHLKKELIYTLDRLDRLVEAEEMAREAVSLGKRDLGPEHPTTLITMFYLGLIYSGLGQSEEAVALLEEVLSAYKKTWGPTSENTLRTMADLALLYADLGQNEQAEVLSEEALTTGRANDLDELSLTILLEKHSIVLRAGRKLEEAIAVLKEALEMGTKAYGASHPKTLRCQEALALWRAEKESQLVTGEALVKVEPLEEDDYPRKD